MIKITHLLAILILLVSYGIDSKVLPTDQAFQLQLIPSEPYHITLKWNIQPNYQIYKKSIKIIAQPTIGMHYQLPEANHSDQPASYQHQLIIPISIPQAPDHFTLKVSYQGCLRHQLCYPPVTKKLTLLNNQGHLSLEQSTSKQPFLLKLFTFFGLGLLLSMTPCVLPMLPISCSMILGSKQPPSTPQAFKLSLCYVLCMAITYASTGVLAASLGMTLQSQLQSPWALWFFALLCCLMGYSMMQDRFKLRLPQAWLNALAKATPKSSSNPYLRVGTMGVLCTLMLSPCISAPLVTVLAYIGLHHAPWQGGSMLFVMGIGMGVPILLINTLGRHCIPRNGAWTQALQIIMGIFMGGLALWLLRSQLETAWLWALSGLWLAYGLWQLTTPWLCQNKRLLAIGLLGMGYLGGYAMLQHHQRMDHLVQADTQNPAKLLVSSAKALSKALDQHKNHAIIIEFYADWCIACQELNTTLAELSDYTQSMKIIKVDISKQDDKSKALQKAYHVYAPPSLILLSAKDHTLIQRFDGKPSKIQLIAALSAPQREK